MKKTVQLGAPSLNGKDANELVTAAFSGCLFPLQVIVTNLVAHALTFPEVAGLHVAACTDADKRAVTVEIRDMDAFQRLASSIEQIAELNHHEIMLEIEALEVTTFQEDAGSQSDESDSEDAVDQPNEGAGENVGDQDAEVGETTDAEEISETVETVEEAPSTAEKQTAGKTNKKKG
jgi:hypothetical protein